MRFIKDADSALAALHSGEIHLYYGIAETKYDIVEGDSKLALQTVPSNSVAYLLFNTSKRPVAESAELRKAVLYSINQEEIQAYYGGKKFSAVSTVSPLVQTGLELKADSARAKEFLNAYKASKK